MKAILLAAAAVLLLSLGGCLNAVDVATCNQFCESKGATRASYAGNINAEKECACVFPRPPSHVQLDLPPK